MSMHELFEFHEPTLAYSDGPQEGFVREHRTKAWYRFRCLRLAEATWMWVLCPVPEPSSELGVSTFETAAWLPGARVFLEAQAEGIKTVLREFRVPEADMAR